MKRLVSIIIFVCISSLPQTLFAEEHGSALVAVAANFMGTLERLAAEYQSESGTELQLVSSSTGKLYAQIKNGAPYDLFLAADARRPELLAEEGYCEEPFVYAVGEVVLWTKDKSLTGEKSWQDVVGHDGIGKIAVATPKTAPYGAAAFSALAAKGLLDSVNDKLVYGHNVAQAFQFASLGSADLGFTALSLALSDKGKQGVFWRVPEAESVVQKGCVVRKSADKPEVESFLEFLARDKAKGIMHEFGYK